jgi:hypothetical protein
MKKIIKRALRLFCFLELHDWKIASHVDPCEPLPLYRCTRCGIGHRVSLMGNRFLYPKHYMDKLLAGDKQ